MRCPHCNREIKDDAKFCGFCGARLSSAAGEANSSNSNQHNNQTPTETKVIEHEAPTEPKPEVLASPGSVQQTAEAPASKPKKSPLAGIFITLIALAVGRCVGAAAGRAAADSMSSNDSTPPTTTSIDYSDDDDSESDYLTSDEQETADTTATDSDEAPTYADDASATIDYPSDWAEVKNEASGANSTYHFDEQTNGDAFIMEYVQEMSLDPQSQEARANMEAHELGFEMAFSDVEVTRKEDFEIDGCPAMLIELEGAQDGTRFHIERVVVATPTGLTSYSAASSSDTFEQYRDTFESILDTIHVR